MQIGRNQETVPPHPQICAEEIRWNELLDAEWAHPHTRLYEAGRDSQRYMVYERSVMCTVTRLPGNTGTREYAVHGTLTP